MKPLLIEIGSEEIPARFVPKGLELLREDLTSFLKDSSITYGNIEEYATPRRLALLIHDVAEKQKDETVESTGPSRKAAYDADGNPTKAAEGFARSLGIDVSELTVKETEKGEYVSAVVEKTGRPTTEVLAEALPNIIYSLKLPKSMRWGDTSLRYFRPIQWVAAIFGNEVVPFELDGIKSGDLTYGHRFLAPDAVKIDDPASYASMLKKAHVIADPAERREMIAKGIKDIAADKAKAIEDEELIDTVTNLVEHPTPVLGEFEDKYLALPRELLITVMKSHQKYFAMEDPDGKMAPSFVVISNMNSDINATVKRGAERVLRARLEDARFYFEDDSSKKLWDIIPELKSVTFQEKLGSVYEKAERISSLAAHIAERINPDLKDKAQRASMLCKADLVTGVVGEFPELQGYMGMMYANISGEDKDVAEAINEHYMPRFAGDDIPSSELGKIVSLADKLDNIAAFFYLGMIPSGSEDPFALRRQAAGIIHTLRNMDYPDPLNSLIDASLGSFYDVDTKKKELTGRILEFFNQRLEGILLSEGHSYDIVNAALSSMDLNLKDIEKRINILTGFRKDHSNFSELVIAAKRACNILKENKYNDVNEALFVEDEEKELFEAAKKVREETASGDFRPLFKLKEPIDAFFDKVLVMDKDEKIKENRLALLANVRDLFNKLGDFSKIVE